MLLFLLLQLVVEGLELGVLVRGPSREDSVDVLAEGDLWTETVHLVVVRVAGHAKIGNASTILLLRLLTGWELVEVWCLLNHAQTVSFCTRYICICTRSVLVIVTN